MMRLRFLILLLLPAIAAKAQSVKDTRYLRYDGEETKPDSADYYRIVQKEPAGKGFILNEYYPDKTPRLTGKVSAYDPFPVFEGEVISYDSKGNKTKTAIYEKGVTKGTVNCYYPNGKLKKTVAYGADSGTVVLERGNDVKTRVSRYLDSAGAEIRMDGKHIFHEVSDNTLVEEEGAYTDGLKTGTWKGTIKNEKCTYIETFDKGQFLSGQVTTSDGRVISYAKADAVAEFPGGQAGLARYVQRNFRWPEEAIRNGGMSGTEILAFVVNKDGTITNCRVISSMDKSVDKEAVSVLSKSPAWLPAKQHGLPVKTTFTLPLKLSVQGGSSPFAAPVSQPATRGTRF